MADENILMTEEEISQVTITNSSERPYELFSGEELVARIEPGSCFGYMVEENKDLIIRFSKD